MHVEMNWLLIGQIATQAGEEPGLYSDLAAPLQVAISCLAHLALSRRRW